MEYQDWKCGVFALETTDPCSVDIDAPAFNLPLEIAIDYIDRCLIDQDMYRFTEQQLVCGFNLIISGSFTDYPLAYYDCPDVRRSLIAIRNLRFLYSGFFQRFCTQSLSVPPNDASPMLIFCHSFWDSFPLFPREKTSTECVEAALDVMELATQLDNPHCIVGALQAIASWHLACVMIGNDRPARILRSWKDNPTSNSSDVVALGNRIIEVHLGTALQVRDEHEHRPHAAD